MKLWAGRFSEANDKLTDEFNNSLKFDKVLYKYDIIGSVAHVEMLGRQNIISNEEAEKIKNGLEGILIDLQNDISLIDEKNEDIHMAIETMLIERIGNVAKKMHTARSRNDQVALDMKMYAKEEIENVKNILKTLIIELLKIAEENTETFMPGYTHLQRAQVITFAHHLLAYVEMFKRDISRLDDTYKRLNVMPLGAGALAGSTFNIDRQFVSDKLGFSMPTENSLDSVSDRDYIIELLSDLSVIMMHLSRFCEEIIIWSTDEFKFITLSDKFSTGSSMMPQKKNPDVAELIRGKTGRVYGSLMSMLTVMKGIPLAYNKDMQEDKESTFDAVNTVKVSLNIFIGMISTVKINYDNMLNACENSFMNATTVAEYLVKKGVSFRDAHFAVGRLVGQCEAKDIYLKDLSLNEFKKANKAFEEDIYEIFNITEELNIKEMIGSPSSNRTKEYIEKTLEEFK